MCHSTHLNFNLLLLLKNGVMLELCRTAASQNCQLVHLAFPPMYKLLFKTLYFTGSFRDQ